MKRRHMKLSQAHRGVMLIESLVAILLFSIGILALLGMYANAVGIAADSQYRLEANNYAMRILNHISVEANYDSSAALAASLDTYAHNPDTTGTCDYSGGASNNAAVQQWAASIKQPGSGLPGVEDSHLQIAVNTAANNLVAVTVCWIVPSDPTKPRREMVAMNINSINK